MPNVLVVAALAAEVAHVGAVMPDAEILVTGVGKTAAAVGLAQRLTDGSRPDLVVNLGTAGALDSSHTGVVEIGYVTQHDFPYPLVEVMVGPLSRGYALSVDSPPEPTSDPPPGSVVAATGDVFVADAAQAAAIAASGVHVVEMEAFSYAATCAMFGVPMRCAKAISDFADAGAGVSWLELIDDCAKALAGWLAQA